MFRACTYPGTLKGKLHPKTIFWYLFHCWHNPKNVLLISDHVLQITFKMQKSSLCDASYDEKYIIQGWFSLFLSYWIYGYCVPVSCIYSFMQHCLPSYVAATSLHDVRASYCAHRIKIKYILLYLKMVTNLDWKIIHWRRHDSCNSSSGNTPQHWVSYGIGQ